MRDGARARESLNQLGLALGAPDTPRKVIEALYRSSDPFEVGVAATFSSDAPPRALVYYNPRRRDPAFVRRVRSTFAAFGLDAGWLSTLNGAIPLTRVSTIAGFDVDATGVPGGTLYFEELDERLGGHAVGLVDRVASQLRLPVGEGTHGRVGAPYILAVDFGRAGPERLKLYHFAAPGERSAVQAEAAAVCPSVGSPDAPAAQVLFGDGSCSGYIIQRAHGAHGLVRHKVYRCLPYEREATAGVARRALQQLGLLDQSGAADALLEPSFGTTSIGVAFTPDRDQPEYVSVYQCLLRGDPPATRGS